MSSPSYLHKSLGMTFTCAKKKSTLSQHPERDNVANK